MTTPRIAAAELYASAAAYTDAAHIVLDAPINLTDDRPAVQADRAMLASLLLGKAAFVYRNAQDSERPQPEAHDGT